VELSTIIVTPAIPTPLLTTTTIAISDGVASSGGSSISSSSMSHRGIARGERNESISVIDGSISPLVPPGATNESLPLLTLPLSINDGIPRTSSSASSIGGNDDATSPTHNPNRGNLFASAKTH
jgi:hypothetical protein